MWPINKVEFCNGLVTIHANRKPVTFALFYPWFKTKIPNKSIPV